MGFHNESNIYREVSIQDTMPEGFILDYSPEDYEKSNSKFAAAGLHLAELGLPEWENVGQSIRFPFVIIEEGADNGKEGKIVAGVSKVAAWKIKEIESAAGVTIMTKTKDGKMSLNPEAVAGKQVKVLYVEQVDTRSPEQGGKGTRYTKADSFKPVTATNESLGI